MSTVLKEMYKPEERFVHVITTSYKSNPNRTTVNYNHAKVESGEGDMATWYNKAERYSRNNPDHHVYLKTFKKIQDASGNNNLTHYAHHCFVGGQEASFFDLREEEILDELFNDRSGGGGHGHPFFHRITAIDSSFRHTDGPQGYGDPFHWLNAAQQLSVKNPHHVFKISHYRLVHFRNGGSGYQHVGNRFFHQGRETSLTNPNLHELNDNKNRQNKPYHIIKECDPKTRKERTLEQGYGTHDEYCGKAQYHSIMKPNHHILVTSFTPDGNFDRIVLFEKGKRYAG